MKIPCLPLFMGNLEEGGVHMSWEFGPHVLTIDLGQDDFRGSWDWFYRNLETNECRGSDDGCAMDIEGFIEVWTRVMGPHYPEPQR